MKVRILSMFSVGLLGGLLAGAADANITYNLSLSGDVAGTGQLVLKDGSLDSDGVFDLGPQLVNFELSVPALSLVFTSLYTGDTGVEYKAAGGMLAGADLLSHVSAGSTFWTLDFGNFSDGAAIDWGYPKLNILVGRFGSPPAAGCSTSFAGDVYCNGTTSAIAVPAVPLPAAAWLLLSGLAGLGALRQRKT